MLGVCTSIRPTYVCTANSQTFMLFTFTVSFIIILAVNRPQSNFTLLLLSYYTTKYFLKESFFCKVALLSRVSLQTVQILY